MWQGLLVILAVLSLISSFPARAERTPSIHEDRVVAVEQRRDSSWKSGERIGKIVKSGIVDYYTPLPGYVWADNRGTGIRNGQQGLEVKWEAGERHPYFRNLKTGDRADAWTLAPGYDWVGSDEQPEDLNHEWSQGLRHPEHKNIIAAEKEGEWAPAPGYSWESEPRKKNDFRVKWTAGKPHILFPHIIAAEKEGSWVPVEGYRWKHTQPPSVLPKVLYAARQKDVAHVFKANGIYGSIAKKILESYIIERLVEQTIETGKWILEKVRKQSHDFEREVARDISRDRDRRNAAGERYERATREGKLPAASGEIVVQSAP